VTYSLRLQAKAITTYNQVADELVSEYKNEDKASCDEKNIRRRAYDALNVLTAMDIISKDKKHIRWKGFMNGDLSRATDMANQDGERELLLARIQLKKEEILEKEERLADLALHFVALCRLLRRNGNAEPFPTFQSSSLHKIFLPFVLGNALSSPQFANPTKNIARFSDAIFACPVQTDEDNSIECQVSEDKHAADLSCEKPFALYDDKEVLNLSLKSCLFDEAEVDNILPPHIAHFAKKYLLELSHHSGTQSVDNSAESDPELDSELAATVENEKS
jgi:transcription factor Dp-1